MVKVSNLRRTIALVLFLVLSSMPFDSNAFDTPPHHLITRDVLSNVQVPIRGTNRTFTEDAIKQVNAANERTDSRWRMNAALFHPEWHFTNETFTASSNSLWTLRNLILDALRADRPNGNLARERLGRALHGSPDAFPGPPRVTVAYKANVRML